MILLVCLVPCGPPGFASLFLPPFGKTPLLCRRVHGRRLPRSSSTDLDLLPPVQPTQANSIADLQGPRSQEVANARGQNSNTPSSTPLAPLPPTRSLPSPLVVTATASAVPSPSFVLWVPLGHAFPLTPLKAAQRSSVPALSSSLQGRIWHATCRPTMEVGWRHSRLGVPLFPSR